MDAATTPLHTLPDEALMQAYGRGNANAFEPLYTRHSLRLWRYLYRNTGDRALADDLAQEAWIAVVDSANSYEIKSKFTTWLFTIAHHRLVDHWRRLRPSVSLSADDAEAVAWAEQLFVASGFEPDQALDRQRMAQQLLAAVAQLPDAQRACFLLQMEGDMSVADIAHATGVNEETAKSRLRYARAKLRAALEEWV